MLRMRPAFGFNFSPDDDLPDGVPGFRIDQPDMPDSGTGSYGTPNANPFASAPIPSADPSFSRHAVSSLLAGNPYSSWPAPPSADASLVRGPSMPSASSAVPSGYDPYAGTPQLMTPTAFGSPGTLSTSGLYSMTHRSNDPVAGRPTLQGAAQDEPGGAANPDAYGSNLLSLGNTREQPQTSPGLTLQSPDGNLTLARYEPDGELNQYGLEQAQAKAPQPDLVFDRSPGTVVVLPDGSEIPDTIKSPTGKLMSPVADLSAVAAEGKRVGAIYRSMLNSPHGGAGASAYLMAMLGADVGHYGRFDYQRQGNPITGVTHLNQFQPVSNFNVGLFAQQAGLTLEETLKIAGKFAEWFSGNADCTKPHCLHPIQFKFITEGFKTGQSGAFDPPSTRFGYPL